MDCTTPHEHCQHHSGQTRCLLMLIGIGHRHLSISSTGTGAQSSTSALRPTIKQAPQQSPAVDELSHHDHKFYPTDNNIMETLSFESEFRRESETITSFLLVDINFVGLSLSPRAPDLKSKSRS